MSQFRKKYTGLKSITKISNGTGGTIELPIFTIFSTPSDLINFAEVPSFKIGDSHKSIANNLKTPPTKEWQRPLNDDRVAVIGDYFGTSSAKRLMPNPILVGESTNSRNPDNLTAEINITAKIDSNGNAIPDVYEIEIINNGNPALWILDGQHRTYGLASNRNTKDQNVPVVMLIKHDEYTMQFLAQIFTEVTTGASDLEEIHKNWMEYSFGMGNYNVGTSGSTIGPYDKAMRAVLHMTTLGELDGTQNIFFDHVKFNPYDTAIVEAYKISWTSKQWTEEISNNYYKINGALEPNLLAEQIIRFLRAAYKLDAHKTSGSRFFGDMPFKVLLNHLIWQFLQNLDTLGQKTQEEWENHLRYHEFEKADWRLQWAIGSQSSHWGRYSNRASEFVFKRLMSGTKFDVSPDIALRGPSEITLSAFTKTNIGKKSKINSAKLDKPSGSININGGAPPWSAGADRRLIEFSVPKSGIGSIVSMEIKDAGGQTDKIGVNQDSSTSLLDLSFYKSPIDVSLWTCCFNEASKKKDDFTIQW